MGFWNKLGQVALQAAPYVAAPFTGGASLMAAPMTGAAAGRLAAHGMSNEDKAAGVAPSPNMLNRIMSPINAGAGAYGAARTTARMGGNTRSGGGMIGNDLPSQGGITGNQGGIGGSIMNFLRSQGGQQQGQQGGGSFGDTLRQMGTRFLGNQLGQSSGQGGGLSGFLGNLMGNRSQPTATDQRGSGQPTSHGYADQLNFAPRMPNGGDRGMNPNTMGMRPGFDASNPNLADPIMMGRARAFGDIGNRPNMNPGMNMNQGIGPGMGIMQGMLQQQRQQPQAEQY